MAKRALEIKKVDDYKQLTRQEQETIITFNKEDELAEIFTYDYKWIRHLEQKLGIKPNHDNGFGGRSYEIPKKRIGLPKATRAKKILTEEQRQKIAERLKMARDNT